MAGGAGAGEERNGCGEKGRGVTETEVQVEGPRVMNDVRGQWWRWACGAEVGAVAIELGQCAERRMSFCGR